MNEKAALPNNLEHWIPIILATMLALIVFISGVAVAQHQADEQFITSDELKQSVAALGSYTEETKLLAQYTLNQSSPKAYAAAYVSSLQKAVDSASEKLTEHPHAKNIDNKVSTTLKLANNLSDDLQTLGTQPHDQLPPHLTDSLSQLSDNFDNLEQQL